MTIDDPTSDKTNAPVLDRALELIRFLRTNCDWDAAQTPDSLIPFLLEEAHEVADAVADRDDLNLTGELGDLLLNVAFQIVLAEERRAFAAEDVVRTLESKMRRRHPHLYGDGPREDWEELKKRERDAADSAGAQADPTGTDADPTGADTDPARADRGGSRPIRRSVLHGLPRGIDPLSKAHRIQDRVAAVGFDWPDVHGPLDKVGEELAEVRAAIESGDAAGISEEIGDLLFAAVNLARLAGTHPVEALSNANSKFVKRFTSLEMLAAERGLDMDKAGLEELDKLWDEVKKAAK